MPEFKTPFATEINAAPVADAKTAAQLRQEQLDEWGQYVAAERIYSASGALAFVPGHAVPASSVSDSGPVLPSQVVRRTAAVDEQVVALRTAAGPHPQADADAKPAGNATAEEWRAYAVGQGLEEDVAASMGRDELRDRYAETTG